MSAKKTLCDLCNGLSLNALRSETGYQHATDPDTLKRSAESCPSCAALHEEYEYCFSGALSLRLVTTLNSLFQKLKGISKHEDEVLENLECLERVQIIAAEESIAETYDIPWRRTIRNTSSPESFRFLQRCSEYCMANHPCCNQSSFQLPTDASKRGIPEPRKLDTTNTPSRLINVNPSGTEEETEDRYEVRLDDVSNNCPQYMTLSHCWGQSLGMDCCTSTGNLANRKLGIAFGSLPRTFQDAVTITRRLGLCYLWIDSLCIMQDSPSDWAAESIKMGDIYDNSFLTIAASASSDSSGGCFRHDLKGFRNLAFESLLSSYSIHGLTYNINGPLSSENSCQILVHITDSLDDWAFDSTVNGCPLSRRGWVCQERILSPQTIHYTEEQLVWECREMYATEDYISPMPSVTEARFPLDIRNLEYGSLIHRWQRLIRTQYSKREFTFRSDRLVACSGIAKLYQQYLKSPYLAGLWLSILALDLCWAPASSTSRKSPTQPRKPSWTWTSVHFLIRWLPLLPQEYEQDINFEFLGVNLCKDERPAEEFGPINSGCLALCGAVREGCIITIPSRFGEGFSNSFKVTFHSSEGDEVLSTKESWTFSGSWS